MFVKDRMTRDPYTIQVTASINTLIGLMRDKKLRKVPVLDGEKLVGIVTDRDIERVSPSKATSLSVYEINYLLSKITVADAMVAEVITCSPDDYLEDAALGRRAGGHSLRRRALADAAAVGRVCRRRRRLTGKIKQAGRIE